MGSVYFGSAFCLGVVHKGMGGARVRNIHFRVLCARVATRELWEIYFLSHPLSFDAINRLLPAISKAGPGPRWLGLLLLAGPAWADSAAPALAAALNADGTLRAGASGSFDATGYRLSYSSPTGGRCCARPAPRPWAGTW